GRWDGVWSVFGRPLGRITRTVLTAERRREVSPIGTGDGNTPSGRLLTAGALPGCGSGPREPAIPRAGSACADPGRVVPARTDRPHRAGGGNVGPAAHARTRRPPRPSRSTPGHGVGLANAPTRRPGRRRVGRRAAGGGGQPPI